MTRPWIKMHTTLLDDVRLLKLNDRQQLRYLQMYLLAGRLNQGGLFIENNERLSLEDIAIKLRIADVKQFNVDFQSLKKAGLIKTNGRGPYIAAFGNEQVDWSKKQAQERERQKRHRHGNVTRDKEVTSKLSRMRHAPVTPLDQNQIKKKIKKKKEIKNHQPPTPSSKAQSETGKVGKVGGQNKTSDLNWINDLPKHERAYAEIITPILVASGLGVEKISPLISKVATRIKVTEAKAYTLAALASCYADDDVKHKAGAAAYRMEHNTVPVQFSLPDTWRVLPQNVLDVAGIEIHNQKPATSNNVIQKVAINVR